MVGVRGVMGGVTTGKGRVPARGSAGGFSLGGVPAGGAAATQAAASVQATGLLALQESAPAGERDARARKRGEALLRSLSDLQLGLLDGSAAPAQLRALAALVPGEEAADPALAMALAAIRLRARVELARHGLDPAASPD